MVFHIQLNFPHNLPTQNETAFTEKFEWAFIIRCVLGTLLLHKALTKRTPQLLLPLSDGNNTIINYLVYDETDKNNIPCRQFRP